MKSKNLLGKLKMFIAVLVSTLVVLTCVLLTVPMADKAATADTLQGPAIQIYTAQSDGTPIDLLEADNSAGDVEFWLFVKIIGPGDFPLSEVEINLYYDNASYNYSTYQASSKFEDSNVEAISSEGALRLMGTYDPLNPPEVEDIAFQLSMKLLRGKYPRKFELDKGYFTSSTYIEDSNFKTYDKANNVDIFYGRDVQMALDYEISPQCNQATIVLPDLKAVESVSLDRTAYSLDVGQKVQLNATIAPSDALDKNVIWSTSDPDVASVVNGAVTGVGAGTATIRVTTADGGYTADCIVVVSFPIGVESVTLNKEILSLVKGNSFTLEATVSPDDAANKNISWSTSNASVATVVDGVVTAKDDGTATITVTTEDGGKTATCEVTVTTLPVAVESVSVQSAISVTVGNTATLSATITPLIATNQNVTWSSEDPTYVTVSESGVITAKKVTENPVKVTVTTEDGNKSAECEVTVLPIAVTGITLNKSNESVKINNTLTISATVSPSNATDKTVIWTSSDNNVATVENGVVTGIADGDIIITATTQDGSYSAICMVNVYTIPISVTGVALNGTASLVVGSSMTLSHTLSPFNATNKNVTWSSSNPAVAQVTGNGFVTGRSAGTADITVTTEDGGKTATCVVTVSTVPVTGVSLSPTLSIRLGNSSTLTATVTPSNATNKKLVWASDNTSVVMVVDGVVSAKAEGTANITVTTDDGNYSATCEVTVLGLAVSVSGITLNSATASLNVGDSVTLIPTVEPATATNKTVIWSSSDTSIATVVDGVVTAVGAGTATITATTAQGNLTAECEVTVTTVAVTGVTLNKTTLTMVKENSTTLVATVNPSNATNKNVSWSSSNTAVATVVDGVVSAKTAGTANIIVTTADGSKTATCVLTVVNEAVPVTGVTLDVANKALNVGETFTLTATVSPADATNKDVYWWSSDTAVATVSNTGVVTAVGAGSANINAYSADNGEKLDNCAVTVTAPVIAVSRINLNKSSLKIEVGKTDSSLTATIVPANASNKNFRWESDDENIATVSTTGVITAVAVGNTFISAISEDGSKTVSCNVRVTPEVIKPSLEVFAASDVAGNNRIENIGTLDNSENDVTFYLILETETPASVPFDNAELYFYFDKTVYTYEGSDNSYWSDRIDKGSSETLIAVENIDDETYECIHIQINYLHDSHNGLGTDRAMPLRFALKKKQKPAAFAFDLGLIYDEDETSYFATALDEDSDYYDWIVGYYHKLEALENGNDVINASEQHPMYFAVPDVIVPSPDTTLNWIKVNGVEANFNETESRYEATVAHNVSSVEVDAEAVSPATITGGKGNYTLSSDEKEVTVTVKAEDGKTTQPYTLVITREPAPVAVTGVALDNIQLDMVIGDIVPLAATVSPEDAANKNVSWSTDNEGVAEVYNGLVTAVGVGTATITVTTEDGGKTATCIVNVTASVVAVTGVSLDLTNKAVTIGDTFTLTATVLPGDASNKEIIWSSSNTSVATVVDGVVTAIAEGTADITVVTAQGNKTATCVVTVSPISVTGVSIDSTLSLVVGNSASLTATVTPADATNKNVSWSSDDQTVATVVDGVVTALRAGTATITVTTADGNKTATCAVTVADSAVAVTGVTLDILNKNITIGETFTLTATVLPEDATDKTISWSSSDTSVVTVSNGIVTGVGLGTAVISVTTQDGSFSATCNVNVRAISVTGVTLDSTELSLVVGDGATLTATVSPANADNTAVSWSSSDEDVATVLNGVVTAVGAGTATITVTTQDGNLTATCEVTVASEAVAVTGVTLNKETLTLQKGETATLVATVAPDNATNKIFNWTSGDTSIATVENGVVTAISEGTVTIKVITADGGKIATCEVTVTPVAVTGVSLNRTDETILIGSKLTLVATVAPENADNQNVTWSSNNEGIATVENGVVTAVGEGYATITVTTEDGNKNTVCTVRVVTEIISVESVSLSDESKELKVGETYNLTATVLPENALNKRVSWYSSDSSIALVVNGQVTARKAGTATISVTTEDGSKTATCEITVSNIDVDSITLDKATLYVVKCDNGSLTATILPANATNKNVIWSSDNENIATVSSTGVVTGVNAGMTTIYAKSADDESKIVSCYVYVYEEAVNVTGVTLNRTQKTDLKISSTFTLVPTIAPNNATNTAVSWSSSDESIVTVEDGVVTAVGEGTAIITVTTQDGEFTATCEVTTIDYRLKIESTSSLYFATYSDTTKSLTALTDGKVYDDETTDKVFLSGFTSDMFENNGYGALRLSALIDKLEVKDVTAYNASGNRIGANGVVTNNSKIVLYGENGQKLQEVTVILLGDVNCDGSIDAYDMSYLIAILAGNLNPSDYQMLSANIAKQGTSATLVDSDDINALQKHSLENRSLFA